MSRKTPFLTADTIILHEGKIVLVERGNEPFKGKWALPGGFVEIGEKVEQAAVREAKEETGLDVELLALLGVYSDPERDPRGHTCSVVYIARSTGGELRADDDAADVKLIDPDDNPDLAFDHSLVFSDAIQAAKRTGLL
ncbi:MAG TPA: NUDIX hydrolase [bacterium]|nr:NUDIX hydrolase [bacterium]